MNALVAPVEAVCDRRFFNKPGAHRAPLQRKRPVALTVLFVIATAAAGFGARAPNQPVQPDVQCKTTSVTAARAQEEPKLAANAPLTQAQGGGDSQRAS